MLDFSKITFNEVDDSERPLQIFYNYDLSQNGIEEFIERYATEDDIPKEASICNVELCLTIYSESDFKLEGCCTDTENDQYWVDVDYMFTNADEFISLIPDCEKKKLV